MPNEGGGLPCVQSIGTYKMDLFLKWLTRVALVVGIGGAIAAFGIALAHGDQTEYRHRNERHQTVLAQVQDCSNKGGIPQYKADNDGFLLEFYSCTLIPQPAG